MNLCCTPLCPAPHRHSLLNKSTQVILKVPKLYYSIFNSGVLQYFSGIGTVHLALYSDCICTLRIRTLNKWLTTNVVY